ncbi:hypothetical protein WR25_18491 [Diploscapter pachys]|uniref:E3 ubiquitin-protein ligase n=1 Tax=Diploscapter pachys TaxID=2018661 RepID=A0A2A2JTR5_9BILA|nr:hypothetical protein WR25_18491 [Diploscapter pachys]
MLLDLVSAVRTADWPRCRKLLYAHWLQTVPALYTPTAEVPWNQTHDDEAINEKLFLPLASAFCANFDLSEPSLISLNEQAGTTPESRKPGQICGHVFKSGELTYSCKDCATDPTCVMCHDCFQNSIHVKHRYKMHPSGGSGYCDCGDSEAWSDGYSCSLHTKTHEQSEKDAEFQLPSELEERIRNLLKIIFNYSIGMLCYKELDNLPDFLNRVKDMSSEGLSTCNPYLTVLYNDESHTYESVMRVLELCVHCSKDTAMLVATLVDREGRTAVKVGMKQDCVKIKGDIQRRTARDPPTRRHDRSQPLEVKVMESIVYAHQVHAVALITWLNNQINSFSVLSEIIGDILLTSCIPAEDQPVGGSCEDDSMQGLPEEELLVCRMMKCDRKLWKTARVSIHQLFMKTILMHPEQKMQFAKHFLENIDGIYSDFIEDDQDLDVSVVSLTVQFLTVPAIARKLIAEEDAMSKIFIALLKHMEEYVKNPSEPAYTERFDFTQRSFPISVKRAMHMMKDESYMLNQIPTDKDWTPQLRDAFLKGVQHFIDFLHRMQGMDEVKRQAQEHQMWELEWETAFNIQLRIKETISFMLAWAASDQDVHDRMLLLVLSAMEKHRITTTATEGGTGATHAIVTVDTDQSVCVSFDVLKGGVSIHQPLWRLCAGLFQVPPQLIQFMRATDEEALTDIQKKIVKKVKEMDRNFYELPLRVIVLCAQAGANLWRRNGFSLVNQIHNYFSPLCRTQMFDKDILTLQIGACLISSRDYLLHLLCRFGVDKWAESGYEGVNRGTPYGKMEQTESSKITVQLAEEFFNTIIMVTGERYYPGVGEITLEQYLEREVLHLLCCGPQPFSSIQSKATSNDPLIERLSVIDAVNAVADFKKPATTMPGLFHVKESRILEYNPFFYHYSRSDLSQAEKYQQSIRTNKAREIKACPPPLLCKFTPFFAPVRELLCCRTLIRTCRIILERTARKSRFTSDRLFHRALWVIAMALNEEEADPSFRYVSRGEEEQLLKAMEALSGSPESTSFADLLWWTIKKYKSILGSNDANQTGNQPETEQSSAKPAEDEKAKKQAIAAKMRAQALAKMSKMQNTFIKNVLKEEVPSSKGEAAGKDEKKKEGGSKDKPAKFVDVDEDEDTASIVSESNFPTCIGPNRTKMQVTTPRRVTCILCQESDNLLPSNGKQFVCAAYVQNSTLFAQGGYAPGIPIRDLASANPSRGLDASTCSHTMHFECYQNLADILLNKERQRPRQQMMFNQKMVDPEVGEYLCPLCKRLSNLAMPLLPALQLTSIQGFSSISKSASYEFDEWVWRTKQALEHSLNAINKPVKSHSRKRSHSERSLLELAKEQQHLAAQQQSSNQISSMSLENSASPSTVSRISSATRLAELVKYESQPSISSSMQDSPPQPSSSSTSASAALPSSSSTTSNASPDDLVKQLIDLLDDEHEYIARDERQNRVSSMLVDPLLPSGSDSSKTKPPPLQGIFDAIKAALPQTSIAAAINNLKAFNKEVPSSLKCYEEMVHAFTSFVIKFHYRRSDERFLASSSGWNSKNREKALIDKQLRGYHAAVIVWQSTAHVARATATVLQHDGKPLFGALNTRQKDCLTAMSRLCAVLSNNMQFMPNAVATMLRILLTPPPESKDNIIGPKSPDASVDSEGGGPLNNSLGSPIATSTPILTASAILQRRPQTHSDSTTNPLANYSSAGRTLTRSEAFESPPPASSSSLTDSTGNILINFLTQLFSANSVKKEPNINILHVDMLSLTLSLMMSIGYSWTEGQQQWTKPPKAPRQLLPDGSVDEANILRLGLVAHYFQVFATFTDRKIESGEQGKDVDMEVSEETRQLHRSIAHLWTAARPFDPDLRDVDRLHTVCSYFY